MTSLVFRSSAQYKSSRFSPIPAVMTKPLSYKGRGSLSNVDGRFESTHTQAVDDDWGSLDADLPPLATTVSFDSSRSVITYNDSPDIPFDRSINPYRGCEHGCIYCFARPSHAYLGFSAGLDFESRIVLKPNAADLLRAALGKRGYRCAPIAIGTNTDAYQPLEREHHIMRGVLEVLAETRHPVSIVTKSSLIERDIDLLSTMAEDNLATVYVSITTLDRSLARAMEPRAAAPQRRLQTVTRLREAGIPVGVMIAPLIPGLTEHDMEAIACAAHEAGAMTADYILIRLPLEVETLFEEWLRQHFPLRADHVMNLIRQCRNGKAYDPRFHQRLTGQGEYAYLLAQRFRLISRKLGWTDSLPQLRCDLFRPPRPDSPQMSFDFFT